MKKIFFINRISWICLAAVYAQETVLPAPPQKGVMLLRMQHSCWQWNSD